MKRTTIIGACVGALVVATAVPASALQISTWSSGYRYHTVDGCYVFSSNDSRLAGARELEDCSGYVYAQGRYGSGGQLRVTEWKYGDTQAVASSSHARQMAHHRVKH
ncbi:hypothetical protein ON058_00855 [Demequina sp. B12]|uniref:hypothetical protein n=1 Tax=Demequina sp. B12 TaxID=2992757 RepID=UPI00237B16E5|nr:hypothetical protein [Demequina sp. B12]MDE0571962.1 hypothetical protein [Demequina sp. B12]